MASREPRRQHTVPKVYLENFTNANGKLFKLRTDLPKRPNLSQKHPSAVCYKPNFYKFNNEVPIGGTIVLDANILEKKGFLYENHMSRLIKKLISPNQSLSTQEAFDLATALFDIKMRNEYIRKRFSSRETLNVTFNNVLSRHKQDREELEPFLQERSISFETYFEIFESLREEWLSNESLQEDIQNRILLESKIEPSSVKRLILNKLARGTWTIIKPMVGDQFVTSDNPGFCQDEYGKIHNTKFGGLCRFYFPSTPYHVLLITSERDAVESLPNSVVANHTFVTTDELKMINQGTYLVANREVYSAREKPLLQTWYTLHRPFMIS